jgi:hypothetical protein
MDNPSLEYMQTRPRETGVATVLRALGEVLRDQVDTAQLRALAYIAGQSLATVHRLGPCETLADVEEEANKVLLKLDWGWLRIESRAEYVQFTHGCPPLRGWFGAEGMAWSGALFEGVFAEWLRGLGAGEQLDLRQVGDAVGADDVLCFRLAHLHQFATE